MTRQREEWDRKVTFLTNMTGRPRSVRYKERREREKLSFHPTFGPESCRGKRLTLAQFVEIIVYSWREKGVREERKRKIEVRNRKRRRGTDFKRGCRVPLSFSAVSEARSMVSRPGQSRLRTCVCEHSIGLGLSLYIVWVQTEFDCDCARSQKKYKSIDRGFHLCARAS